MSPLEFADIEKEKINELPLAYFEKEIVIVDSDATYNDAIEYLRNCRVIGFDTETKPTFKKGRKNRNKVSLVQLADGEKAFLFRINIIGFRDELLGLLADTEIVKVGVAIHDDIRGLRNINEFLPENFIELRTFVRNYGIKNYGVRRLAAIILGARISKSQQLSNWESDEYTTSQQRYAATDAWVCYEMYTTLLTYNNE